MKISPLCQKIHRLPPFNEKYAIHGNRSIRAAEKKDELAVFASVNNRDVMICISGEFIPADQYGYRGRVEVRDVVQKLRHAGFDVDLKEDQVGARAFIRVIKKGKNDLEAYPEILKAAP